MRMQAVPRSAVGGSIKVMRLPLDLAASLLPGNGAGPRRMAELMLDRFEAQVRDIAGLVLGDEVLRDDAARRRVAADERERAQRLRTAARRRTREADEHLAETREEAEEQREQAAERAQRRRADAVRLRNERTQEAAHVQRRRRAANEKAREETDEAIEEQATKVRLEQLERDAATLDEQADVLTAEAEAQRLQDEASSRKAARTSG